MTTALCKMIGVWRNKRCIEMTNGAAEVQLGWPGCCRGSAAEQFHGSFCCAKNNKNAFALSV